VLTPHYRLSWSLRHFRYFRAQADPNLARAGRPIGIAALPVAFLLLPSRHDPEEHRLDLAGNLPLVAWELRLERRGGEPVIQVGLLREHRAFGMGQALALLYFAGFTSLLFTLSILWQEGLGHSALQTGLLVLPFAAGSMLTASNSYRFSRRFGRTAVLAGIGAMLAGQPLIALVLRLSGNSPDFWALAGPGGGLCRARWITAADHG
jgi:hypothetical protein